MNRLKTIMMGTLCSLCLPMANASNHDQLANTVHSFTIETYNFVLNLNLLNELCAMESYLDVNTESKTFNEKLQANISKFAGLADIKDYDADKIAMQVKTKFIAFVQGVRYGGFIADNFIKVNYPNGVCTDEIRTDVANRVSELVKSDEFKIAKDD